MDGCNPWRAHVDIAATSCERNIFKGTWLIVTSSAVQLNIPCHPSVWCHTGGSRPAVLVVLVEKEDAECWTARFRFVLPALILIRVRIGTPLVCRWIDNNLYDDQVWRRSATDLFRIVPLFTLEFMSP